jgi:hypothetical protein
MLRQLAGSTFDTYYQANVNFTILSGQTIPSAPNIA